jgi:hypothetical protein
MLYPYNGLYMSVVLGVSAIISHQYPHPHSFGLGVVALPATSQSV